MKSDVRLFYYVLCLFSLLEQKQVYIGELHATRDDCPFLGLN
jgi:hypothetical protein